MSDILTRLLLKTDDFDRNLKKGGKSVSQFEQGISSMAAKAGKAFAGMAVAIGAGTTAYEVFNKTIAGSQTLTDTLGASMEAAKSSVNFFFDSLAKGDFSLFSTNMQRVINLAREFYREMDTLGSMSLFQDNSIAKIQNQMARDRNTIKNKNSTKAEIEAAQASLRAEEAKLKALTVEYGQQAQTTYYAALRKVVAEQGGGVLTDEQLQKAFGSFSDYDKNIKLFEKLEAERKAAQTTTRIAQTSNYGVASYYDVVADTDKSLSIENSEEYKRLRAIAQAHDDNIKLAKQYESIAIAADSQLIAAEGANIKGFNKGAVSGLPQKDETINVGYKLHYTDVDDMLNPDGILQTMKRDGLIIPVSFELDEELPKEEEIVPKLNGADSYIEGLNGIASAFGSISSATEGSAASMLSWMASVASATASAIPQIMAVTAAKETEANANGKAAVTGAMSSVAAIPIVGAIMAVAAAASIMATIASIPKFENGGIVPGISYSGDKILARLNSGEMVLNKAQQGNLYNMINGGGNNVNISLESARIQGADIYLALSNYMKWTGKKL